MLCWRGAALVNSSVVSFLQHRSDPIGACRLQAGPLLCLCSALEAPAMRDGALSPAEFLNPSNIQLPNMKTGCFVVFFFWRRCTVQMFFTHSWVLEILESFWIWGKISCTFLKIDINRDGSCIGTLFAADIRVPQRIKPTDFSSSLCFWVKYFDSYRMDSRAVCFRYTLLCFFTCFMTKNLQN